MNYGVNPHRLSRQRPRFDCLAFTVTLAQTAGDLDGKLSPESDLPFWQEDAHNEYVGVKGGFQVHDGGT